MNGSILGNDKKKAAGEMEYVKINLDEKRRITQI